MLTVEKENTKLLYCWGGNISKFDTGRLKKMNKKQVMLWESHWTVFQILREKTLYQK